MQLRSEELSMRETQRASNYTHTNTEYAYAPDCRHSISERRAGGKNIAPRKSSQGILCVNCR